jgi:hypothetical protein
MARQMMDIELAKKVLLERHEREMKELEERAKMAPVVTRNAPFTPKPRKGKEAKTAKEVVRKVGPDLFGVALPARGTLDARGFMDAMKNAGKRPFKATNMLGEEIITMRVEQSKVLDDQKIAIAAYVGYDPKGNFGQQEMAARSQAAREIGYAKQPVRKPDGTIATREEDKAKLRQGTPYAKGLPDYHQKRMMELQAQEVLLADTAIESERMVENAFNLAHPDKDEPEAPNPVLTMDEQAECEALYKQYLAEYTIACAKLEQIRKDIAYQQTTEPTFEK